MNMTTPAVQAATTRALEALRDLALAICAARPDGAMLLQSFEDAHVRIVLDEKLGVLEFIEIDNGDGHWLESVRIAAGQPDFGALRSLAIRQAAVTH